MQTIWFFSNARRWVTSNALVAVLLVLGALTPVAHAATCSVTNANNSGTGSLRDEIADVTCDTITFDASLSAGTIYLASVLTLSHDVTIDSSALASQITISGDTDNNGTGDVRVFYVNSGVTATLSSLIITKGAVSSDGGGIYNNGTLTVTNSTLSGNHASWGSAGIYNNGTLMVTNSTLSGNFTYDVGGGIHNNGKLTITNSTLSGNSANHAGGIYNIGTLTVTNSTLSGNADAYTSGGIYNIGPLTITNSTFSGNSTRYGHGSSIVNGGTATITIANGTFSGNSAVNGFGGSIWNADGTVTLRNTIVAHTPTSSGNCFGTITNGSNNIDDDGTCGWGSTNGSMSSTNPLLGALANNGGPTQTFALLTGSPAIDGVTFSAPNGCPSTDQRGIARGTTCDIGAFESQGFTLTKTGGDNQSTVINTAFTNPLALSVTSVYGEPVNGGQVILTAPSSGASITTTLITMTIASGAVSQSVTANGTIGTYNVTASTRGASSTIFSLTNNNPVPTITTLNPASAKAGGVGFTLVVTGTNFITGSTIRWNGSDRVTTFVSATQLTATISASDMATIGTANVAVFTPTPGGGTSNSLVFTIGQATTNLVLTSSPNPSIVGNTVTFTATLTQNNGLARPNSRAPSDVTPTGTVTFTLDATTHVTRTMNASGVTTYATSSLAVGAHTIVATYGGDANLVGAISNTVTQNVKAKLFLPLILR